MDTATSSLKRVVVDLRADFLTPGTSGSVGVGSLSNPTATSLPTPAADPDSWGAGKRTDELLDGRLEPELDCLSIGGGRTVVVRLFSFVLMAVPEDASEGLWGVGVTEVSSNCSLPWTGPALGEAGEVGIAVSVEVDERASLTELLRFLEDRGDGVGVVLMRPPWLMLSN